MNFDSIIKDVTMLEQQVSRQEVELSEQAATLTGISTLLNELLPIIHRHKEHINSMTITENNKKYEELSHLEDITSRIERTLLLLNKRYTYLIQGLEKRREEIEETKQQYERDIEEDESRNKRR